MLASNGQAPPRLGRPRGLALGASARSSLGFSGMLGPSPRGSTTRASRGEYVDGPLDGISVLVVDDEEDARELLVVVLEGAGASVAAAGSASEARALLEHGTFDVLVSDIGMPEEDGYSLVRTLRETERRASAAHLPAIALTAFVRHEDRERAVGAGFDAHLSKPMDSDHLIATLRQLSSKTPTTDG